MRCRPAANRCIPLGNDARSLALLVRSYTIHKRPEARQELRYFANLSSLELVVTAAALATDAGGKRLDHQRRLTQASLRRAKDNLLAALPKIEKCKSFHRLHEMVEQILAGIQGLGELYVYDTSLRIGVFLDLWPQKVYLHRGTRKGAKALGFSASRAHVEPAEMPVSIRKLQPYEIEDFLCIYKAELARLADTSGSGVGY